MPDDRSSDFVDLNVLPEEYRPRMLPAMFKVMWVLAVVLIVVAIPLFIWRAQNRRQVVRLEESIAQAEKTLGAAKTPDAEAIALTEELSQTKRMLQAIQTVYPEAVAGRDDWPVVMDALLTYDQENIHPLELYQVQDELTMVGLARSRDDALTYASDLDRSAAFDQVIIQSMELADQPFETAIPSPTTTPTTTATITDTEEEGTPTATPLPYDEYEIDDFEAQPIALGETQEHNFYPIYDEDRVSFLAKAGRRYCIKAMPGAPGVDTFLEVDVAGQRYVNDDCAPGEDVYIACSCPSSGQTDILASMVEIQVPEPDDQRVQVRITNRGEYGPDKTYSLQIEEPYGDDFENDDTNPKPIAVGQSQARSFYPDGDIDRVTFRAKKGKSYLLRTTGLAAGVDTVLTVKIGDKVYRNDDRVSGEAESQVEFEAVSDDVVHVNVTNKGAYGAGMNYTLKLTEVAGDKYEPDDYDPQPLAVGEMQEHTFYPDGDFDRCYFHVKKDVEYRLSTFDLDDGIDTKIIVYANDKEYENDDVEEGVLESSLTFEADDDGYAQVEVQNLDRYDPDASYWLMLESLTEGPTPTPTPDLRDEYEPDDLDVPYIALGEDQYHNFYPSGDVDRVWFNVKAGVYYELRTEQLDTGVDTVLSLTVNGVAYQNDDVEPGDLSSSVVFRPTRDGRGSATIINLGEDGEDKGYHLVLAPWEPEATATPDLEDEYEPDEDDPPFIALNEDQEHNFFPEGDVDAVRMNLKEGQAYELRTSNLAFGVDTKLSAMIEGTAYTSDDADPPSLYSIITFTATTDSIGSATITNLGQYGGDKTYHLELLPWVYVPTPTPTTPAGPTSTPTPTTTPDMGDQYEPDLASPPHISLGEEQTHTFSPPGDSDAVQFQVKEGRWYELKTSELTLGVDTYLSVYENGKTYSNDDVAEDDLSSRVVFCASQDDVISSTIENLGHSYGPDSSYRLTLSPWSGRDGYEPDDTDVPVILLNEGQQRNFYPTGDVDRVRFQVEENQWYELRTANLQGGADTFVSVSFAGQTWESDNISAIDLGSRVVLQAPQDGWAQANITNLGSYATGAIYDLLFLPWPTQDPYEPDGSYPPYIALGEEQLRNFHPAGDQDGVRLRAKVGITYELGTTGLATGVDTVLSDPSGDVTIISNEDDIGEAGEEMASRVIFIANSNDDDVQVTISNLGQFGPGSYYQLYLTSQGEEETAMLSDGGRYASAALPSGEVSSEKDADFLPLLSRPATSLRPLLRWHWQEDDDEVMRFVLLLRMKESAR